MKLDPQTTFDIDPTLPPTLYYVLCIILSAHTIYIMRTTPPCFPTLYWNYVSYYENGQRTYPFPPTHVNSHSIWIGIMYHVMKLGTDILLYQIPSVSPPLRQHHHHPPCIMFWNTNIFPIHNMTTGKFLNRSLTENWPAVSPSGLNDK